METSPRAHKVILHGRNRQIEFYGKLKDMESKLDDRFYRTHRAFLVNKDHILEVDTNKNLVHMINGEKCMVSTRKIKGLKKEN
ncbi:LytTR family DNA-binding domain-containing protein [Paenilisteria weihenstephanensis]|uniref:LytTR family DNA-binding domain-containing protein n=1 Tax=Listeria weihenstephanensis TaxID=1006155 RepID=UPI0021501D6A|nr:LytTR family DNA-binding domain-containing protein [Listeria weihenstephanensis]